MTAPRFRFIAAALALPLVSAAGAQQADAATPSVLLVGSFNGVTGGYSTIQAAVDAAQPGDWILVGPGDYHEKGTDKAGVYITTPGLHLRGMNRNNVVVDGTNSGGSMPCDPTPSLQDFGPVDSSGTAAGRNGVEVWKADGVSIENLTACNYLSSGGGGNGNEIWWNGGDGSGQVHLGALSGAYLTATSTYNYDKDKAHNPNGAQGKYGIFTSNESGPGVITHTYASNMGDSAYYIGACPDCNVDLVDAHAQNSALAFSGTNAGGHLIIENGEFDNNKAGLGPNTLNNDDAPSPADGTCPNGATGPTGSHSCAVIRNNKIHDNNNPNTPQFGIAGAVPVGTGVVLPGVANYTVTGNQIYNNNSWGVVITDFPDTETPPPTLSATACRGGMDATTPAQSLCYYPAFGNEIAGNTFSKNGSFGNPSNGDLADNNLAHSPGNCFHDNTDAAGLTSDPPSIQTVMGTCGAPGGWTGFTLQQLVCASGPVINIGSTAIQCPPNLPAATYPQTTGVQMTDIPAGLPTMPDPCAGVPANPWCALGASVPEFRPATVGAVGAAMLAAAFLGTLAWRRRRTV
ncbi:MAG TPA: hypothetical protein VG266_12125 [Candidatus Dormibacteraeota bacterium]|nr:hypothetical protein [Candidatus Dormibacteraeota bacterium]